jgi:hypothetical protein
MNVIRVILSSISNKSRNSLFPVTIISFIFILLLAAHSECLISAQVTISPGTDEDAQVGPEIETEEEAASTPEEVPPQQTPSTSKRFSLELGYAHFIPLTNGPGNQVKLLLNYTLNNPSYTNKPINAVMEVHGANQSLLKISSFSEPLIANKSGTIQLATTFLDKNIKEVTATTTITGPGKLVSISNPVTVNLSLGQVIE